MQKGAKGKPKAKAGAGEEGVELTAEEREAKAKLRIEALERELGDEPSLSLEFVSLPTCFLLHLAVLTPLV